MVTTATVATTRNGKVEGREKEGVLLFAGIPYAEPPVGELRFRAVHPNVALFVLAHIQLKGEGDEVTASGGSETVFLPWEIDRGTLNPIGFSYDVPKT